MSAASTALSFLKNKQAQVGLASLGAGVAAWAATGSFTQGYNTAVSALGGATIGYTRNKNYGMWAGAAAGAAYGYGSIAAVKGLKSPFLSAAMTGLTTSVAASVLMTGSVKGGAIYDMARSAYKKTGMWDIMRDMSKMVHGHDPEVAGQGLASNFTAMAKNFVNLYGQTHEKAGKIGAKLFGNKKVNRFLDAAFGSPALIDLANKTGNINKASNLQLAKAIGQDVVEGLPVAIGTGLIGMGVHKLFWHTNNKPINRFARTTAPRRDRRGRYSTFA